MKTYEAPMRRTESKTVKLTAENPQQAILDARAQNPDFHADACTELEEGEVVAEHVVLAVCEDCEKMVFDETEYEKGATDPEGVYICETCYAALEKSSAGAKSEGGAA